MKARKTWWLIALTGLALAIGGCSNDNLDDGDSADVILEVATADTPPVEASLNMDECVFSVEDWIFGMRNRPKNSLAAAPFNDIILDEVEVEYNWFSGAVTPTRIFGLGGVTIETDSEAPATFPPIALNDLSPAFEGSSASLTLTFRAHTVEGTSIRARHTATLAVNFCQQ